MNQPIRGEQRQVTQDLFGPALAIDAGASSPTLADFECERELGRGGNAAVYVARCTTTGDRVALKVIHGDAGMDAKYLERFHREVSNASRLVHDNVCRVFSFGVEGNVLWLAMELIEGGTIRDLIDSAGPLPPQVAALLTAQLLAALDAAHGAGIVHRDIKPANVMVTSAGDVKLIDFGIAKSKQDPVVTETGFLVGTPGYMSPEHVLGRDLDARTDLYAVGISLYEMLLGDNPYANDTPSQALLRIAQEPLPSIFEQDPTVPGVVEALFEHLTERRVADRVASARAALSELQAYVQYVQLMYPGLLARFVADPVGICASLRRDQAELEVARAESLLLAGDANLAAAGLALFRAQRLQPSVDVVARFEAVCARGNLSFGANDDEQLAGARAFLATAPAQPGPAMHLASLYRARGDIYGFAVSMRRYLRLRPDDGHALNQLQLCVEGIASTARGPEGRLRTREILAGVRTGGWARIADEHKEAVLELQRPAIGRRPATTPARPAVAAVPVPRTPSVTPADDARARIHRVAAARPLTAVTTTTTTTTPTGLLDRIAQHVPMAMASRLLIGALMLTAFAAVAQRASKTVETAIDSTQVAMSDNTAGIGAIERNDLGRRQQNLFKDITASFNKGDDLSVIVAVGALLELEPPADLALPAVLTRARSHARLRHNDDARLDYEHYLGQLPLAHPLRAQAMSELNALSGAW